MRRLRLQFLLVWLCLIGQAVAASAPGPRVVLCLGPDGHIAFESWRPAVRNSCLGCPSADEIVETQAVPSGPVVVGAEPGCSCIDLPLFTDPAGHKASRALMGTGGTLAATKWAAPPGYLWPPPSSAGATPSHDQSACASDLMRRLRSVVLIV